MLKVVFGSQQLCNEHLLLLGLLLEFLLLILGTVLGTEDTAMIQLRSWLYSKARRESAM